jgi:hypothetical protein
MDAELVFEEWMKSVPARIRSDPLWDSAYYRFARYLYDLAWLDIPNSPLLICNS